MKEYGVWTSTLRSSSAYGVNSGILRGMWNAPFRPPFSSPLQLPPPPPRHLHHLHHIEYIAMSTDVDPVDRSILKSIPTIEITCSELETPTTYVEHEQPCLCDDQC